MVRRKNKSRVSLKLSVPEAEELLVRWKKKGYKARVRLLERLMEEGSLDSVTALRACGVPLKDLKKLSGQGILDLGPVKETAPAEGTFQKTGCEIILNPDQQEIADSFCRDYDAGLRKTYLLFGVTGSGKTKVIMKAIDRTLEEKKRVIMLVPEIALTPQTVNIFCRRYGERVAVIHSSLSQGEGFDAWRRIKRGDVDLVIGTRSAIFAPVENLGLIVIDEEHEHTYKSESDPKYHARDIAAFRCGKNNALMLLASATPSLESFYKAQNGSYRLVPLRERYGGVRLPDAIVVDMREELRLGNTSPISKRLHTSLTRVYEKDKQAILFLNRRGYSTQINCKECGEVLSCPRCSVSLTYHNSADGGRLLCHMCGYEQKTPKSCPSCSAEKLSFLGYGTQKLEAELNKYLQDMTVLRMDADTTSSKMSYDRMLEDFREGRADILLGTQMVAKGHDFPRVTLVGVALADVSLHVSDFRAAERTFSLLTQVIGRAGRATDGGIAVIQTFAPNNETIRLPTINAPAQKTVKLSLKLFFSALIILYKPSETVYRRRSTIIVFTKIKSHHGAINEVNTVYTIIGFAIGNIILPNIIG
jgi:primosomal protein N' (replication factor Y)